MLFSARAYNENKLSNGLLFRYAALQVPLNALMLPIFLYVPTFYAQERGVNLTLIGTLIFASRMFDAVSDPTIGILSDHTRSRFGRRKPWIVGGMGIAAFACYMLFAPPQSASGGHMIVWLIACYLGWTMISIPHLAWGTELTRNYNQRTRVMAWRDGAEVIGFFMVGLIPFALGVSGEGFSGKVLDTLAVPVAIALIVCVILAVFRTPIGQGQDNAPNPKTNLTMISDLVGNAPYMRLCIGMSCMRIGEGLRTTLAVIFITYYWQRADFLATFMMIFSLGGVLAVPFWAWLSKRIEKGPTWRIVIVSAMAMSPAFFFVDPTNTALITVIIFVSGVIAIGNTMLPNAILGDVIDLDTLRSQQLRAGAYVSVWSFLIKLALAIPVMIAFPILDATGFNVTLGAQNDAAGVLAVGILYALSPILFQLIAVLAVWNFPLSRAQHDIIRRRLKQRSDRQLAPEGGAVG
ncbi:MAG: MFS transporter [Pseudomonadota bacterium]